MTEFSPDYIILPGDSILEMLEVHSMTQKELATRMELTPKTVGEIIKGTSPITQKHARSLELIIGMNAGFWLSLQRNYEDALYKKEYRENLVNQIDIAKSFPQETLKAMGLLPKGRNKGIELVEGLLKVFRVTHLNQVLKLYDFKYNCRLANVSSVDTYALVTWMRLGEIIATSEGEYGDIPPFNRHKTVQFIEKIRNLNFETNPSVFLKELEKACRRLGILFVVVPEIKGSRISGMARWKRVGKREIPMIQLSLRGKRHDLFWFTFLHELGHILLHPVADGIYVDIFDKDRDIDKKEMEADTFAKNILIPEEKYDEFIRENGTEYISRQKVKDFGEEINIHPGIVVGRLQNEGVLKWNQLNGFKETFKWDFEK